MRACFARARMQIHKPNKKTMKLYTQGRLVAVSRESFKDKENGDEIVYFVNVVKTHDGDILNCNSKADFTEYEGDEGLIGVEVSIKQPKNDYDFAQLKFNLREFVKDETLPVIEA